MILIVIGANNVNDSAFESSTVDPMTAEIWDVATCSSRNEESGSAEVGSGRACQFNFECDFWVPQNDKI